MLVTVPSARRHSDFVKAVTVEDGSFAQRLAWVERCLGGSRQRRVGDEHHVTRPRLTLAQRAVVTWIWQRWKACRSAF